MPGVRAEIDRQAELDGNRGVHSARLEVRVAAVADAQRALAAREVGAVWALRQSLIDLASACELFAAELPRPRTPSRPAAVRPRD